MLLTHFNTIDPNLVSLMVEAAQNARMNAYAPYSRYLVGAAIVTRSGKIYAGCNVECADYDGTHAEEAAISSMVTRGERSPTLIVALGGLDGTTATSVSPCGKCRQKLYEFYSLNMPSPLNVLDINPDGTLSGFKRISDLLPGAFGPADLGVNLAKYRR